jgi:phosphoribosylamine--glycine ligase
MNILILGGGGREHAIADRLARDSGVKSVLVFPGNPGMRITPGLQILGGEVSLLEVFKIVEAHRINLVVIGPEKYLFAAYVDALTKAGVPAFGPTEAASFLEASKIKSKIFMKRFRIPTSDFAVVYSEAEAQKVIAANSRWAGFVIKLSGPALGKGVIVTENAGDALEATHQFFLHRPPGIEEGVVIEEKVSGKEVSLFYVCAGEQSRFLASACDHKRLLDDDEGPNTGGMGAYSPCHWVDQNFLQRVEAAIVKPTLSGMIENGTPFSGMLFLGLMVDGARISLLEYNTRFGDPETQSFLPIHSGNLSDLLLASANGKMNLLLADGDGDGQADDSRADVSKATKENPKFSLHVVKAARGYPGLFGEKVESEQAVRVSGNPSTWQEARLYYAGVKEDSAREKLITSGGRVLGVTGFGNSPLEARNRAYTHLDHIHFSGEQFRSDIGGRT